MVDPVAVWILDHHQIRSADISAAIFFMEKRRWKLEKVNIVIAIDILEYRCFSLVHLNRRDKLEILHPVAIGPHDIENRVGFVEAERQRETSG